MVTRPIGAESALIREETAWLRARWADPRLRPARRTCLGPLCRGRRRFDSAWAGERICPACRERLARLYGAFAVAEDAS